MRLTAPIPSLLRYNLKHTETIEQIMRHLFLLSLFLLAPVAPLHSAQEPLDAAVIAELRSDAEQGHAEAQFSLGWLLP